MNRDTNNGVLQPTARSRNPSGEPVRWPHIVSIAALSASSAQPRLGRAERRDAWWVPPLGTGVALAAFGGYAIWAAVQGSDYLDTRGGARYLSPFYSPDIHAYFGVDVPFSFAFLVLWAPLGLRLTCYYYRKAYYRSYFWSPPACAVPGPRRRYSGESRLPLLLQNAHRYFLYAATIVLGFLWYDAIRAFVFTSPSGSARFGIGVGSVVLLANVVALSGFTFGCNSLRHLVGGNLDCFSCSASTRTRHRLWLGVSVLNLRHRDWAWISLATVGLADLYVRLVASGVFDDPRLFL
jgi:hypothetical protein